MPGGGAGGGGMRAGFRAPPIGNYPDHGFASTPFTFHGQAAQEPGLDPPSVGCSALTACIRSMVPNEPH